MYSVVMMAAFAGSPMEVDALLPGRNARIQARAAASCGGFEAGVFRVRRAGVGRVGAGCGGFEAAPPQQFAVRSVGGCNGFQSAPQQQQRYQLVPVPAEQAVPLPPNPVGSLPPVKKAATPVAAPPQQYMLVQVKAPPPQRSYSYQSFDCPGGNCRRSF